MIVKAGPPPPLRSTLKMSEMISSGGESETATKLQLHFFFLFLPFQENPNRVVLQKT